MKRLLIVFIVFLMSGMCFAQKSALAVDTAIQRIVYAQIVGYAKFLSKKVNVSIDFGERTRYVEDTRLRDKNGDLLVFNSMVDAMNFMGDRGWNFMQAYAVTMGNQLVYHFMLSKVVDKDALIDFDTKKDFK